MIKLNINLLLNLPLGVLGVKLHEWLREREREREREKEGRKRDSGFACFLLLFSIGTNNNKRNTRQTGRLSVGMRLSSLSL